MANLLSMIKLALAGSDTDAADLLSRAKTMPGISKIVDDDLAVGDHAWLHRQIAASAALNDSEKVALAYVLDERIRSRA